MQQSKQSDEDSKGTTVLAVLVLLLSAKIIYDYSKDISWKFVYQDIKYLMQAPQLESRRGYGKFNREEEDGYIAGMFLSSDSLMCVS